jgi:hypothetical protein
MFGNTDKKEDKGLRKNSTEDQVFATLFRQ